MFPLGLLFTTLRQYCLNAIIQLNNGGVLRDKGVNRNAYEKKQMSINKKCHARIFYFPFFFRWHTMKKENST